MKKFTFTLQAVLHYRQTIEKKQKAELAKAIAALNALLAEEARIIQAQEDCRESLKRALKKGEDLPAEMERHYNYQLFLDDELEAVRQRIVKAEAEKKRVQTLLIATMQEIKALENLREQQYQAYLEEVRQEEDKLIGDLLSYQTTVAGSK